MSASSQSHEVEDDDVLELCALVEEYKEALDASEAENAALRAQVQQLQHENADLLESKQQQASVIKNLDESIAQLMEDLEQKDEVIASKNSDLESLQHCLSKLRTLLLCPHMRQMITVHFLSGVIHRRKVEVDDQAQLEQSKIIERLYAEKNKISEAYSSNLKILEEYLELINARDSEIMDLKLAIQSYENQMHITEVSEDEKERDSPSPHHQRPAASTTTTPPRAPQRLTNPSPPTSVPPEGMRNGARASQATNTSTTTTTSATTSTTNGTTATTDAARTLASVRAASAAAIRRSSATYAYSRHHHNSDTEDGGEEADGDGDGSPTQPVTINRSRVTKLSRYNSAGALHICCCNIDRME